MIVAIMTTALAGTAWGETVNLLNGSNNTVTVGAGTLPEGVTPTFSSTYSQNAYQMTEGNSHVLTLSGFQGYKITNITLSMKSNSSKGAGKLSYSVNGGDSFTYLIGNASTGVNFNDARWNNAWSTSYVLVSKDVEIETTAEDFILKIEATANSLYCNSYRITYEPIGSSTLEDNDLALTNAPVALNFDLYDNAEPQTISYTTSSTGAVTVSSNDYVSCEVNETAKTITVTPTAVTSGAQTITVNQAADDNYKVGTAIFTVSVDDSTPFTGSIFIFNTDEGLQSLGITKPSSSAGTDLNVNNNYTIGDVSMSITHGTTSTRVWNSNGSTDLRVYKGGGSLTFTVPAGYKITKITFTGSKINFSNVTDKVWQGTPAASVTLSATDTNNITTIAVEYEECNDPVLSADDVNIACNALQGAIIYTLTNPVSTGELTANTTSGWLTLGTIAGTIPFTCEANATATARTATVTLTYTYGDGQTVTKDVSVTQAGKENAGLSYATTSVTKFEGDANFTNTLTNPHSLAVTYSSSEVSVATVDENGEVTILSKGTTTITASYLGDDIYLAGSASYTLVVNEPFVAEDGVFDFVEAGKQGYDYGSGVPIAHSSNGTYIFEDKTWTAVNVTLVSSGKYRWWYNGHELRFYDTAGDNDAIKESAMTISVPEGKVITSIVVSGGKNWITDCGTYANGTWTGYSQTVVFTYTGTSSNNVTKVVVTYEDAISVTFNASGYATFASSSPIDFSGTEAEGYTAWAITSANKTTGVINFSQITGAVAAGTGVLLMGEPNETVYPVVTTSDETPANNLLVGFTKATPVEANQYYGLKGDTFKKVNAGTVPAGKALLPASQVGTDVKAFTFNFEDDATGIENLNVNLNEGAIYNLAGQRLQKMQKGINIVNGKKVLK